MERFRFRPGVLGVVSLTLLLCQCASSPTPGGRSYKGLSLEEWSAIPWKGSLRLHEGTGTFEFQRDVFGAIEALGAFAGESQEALERLGALVADLDEDVREEAAAELARLAFSQAPNRPAAMEVLLAWIESDAAGPSSAALGQLVSELEEREDWSPLGPAGEPALVARTEVMLFEADAYSMAIAFEALRVLARRSSEYEARFLAALHSPSDRFRYEEAADELMDFAEDFEREENATLAPALFQRAAELAVELAPGEPEYLDVLAQIYLHLGDRSRALEASSRALEAASRSPDLGKNLRKRIEENHARLAGSAAD